MFSSKFKDEIKLLTQGANINNISSTINNIKIPLPSLEIQQKIIDEIEGYQQIVFGAKKILNNYYPRISFPDNCLTKKLIDVCEINKNSINPEQKYGDKEFMYVDISSINNKTGRIENCKKIKGFDAPSRARRIACKGDVIISTVRPNLKAFSYIDFDTENFVFSTGFAVLNPKNINGKYLYYILLDDFVMNQFIESMGKAMYPSINMDDLNNLEILVPSLEQQNLIVSQIDNELSAINSSEYLIKLFTDKIKQRLNEIWG